MVLICRLFNAVSQFAAAMTSTIFISSRGRDQRIQIAVAARLKLRLSPVLPRYWSRRFAIPRTMSVIWNLTVEVARFGMEKFNCTNSLRGISYALLAL